ncbi:MAG TPA: ATP-binding cassette domain-containing protein [Polyangiaceae bacterium]|nr:ATP-binding cassette domain-containing protein [Polyangiaceae bacterium]
MSPPNDATVLRATGVSVVLGGLRVLDGVDLAVVAGTVVAVIGANGAGKSTLFKAIAGEQPLTAGAVLLGGVDVTALPLWKRARAGLGYVPQGPSVLFDLSVAENITTFERAARVAARPVAERARPFELEHRLDVRARDLSGGERRRLELLRALVAEPAVLVCDEPFAAGDPGHVRALSKLLRAHADRGGAVLIADHRVEDALSICDEASFLADGRIVVSGPPARVSDHPAVRKRYLDL